MGSALPSSTHIFLLHPISKKKEKTPFSILPMTIWTICFVSLKAHFLTSNPLGFAPRRSEEEISEDDAEDAVDVVGGAFADGPRARRQRRAALRAQRRTGRNGNAEGGSGGLGLGFGWFDGKKRYVPFLSVKRGVDV